MRQLSSRLALIAAAIASLLVPAAASATATPEEITSSIKGEKRTPMPAVGTKAKSVRWVGLAEERPRPTSSERR